MARISGIENNIFDAILPTFGNPRTVDTPIWNESQSMFITDQYTSAAGNTYYLGVRFSDRFVTILHIGLYHNWTYINEVELFTFNGKDRQLVGKAKLDTYYSEDLVRATTESLLKDHLESQLRLNGFVVEEGQLKDKVKQLVQNSYCSMLDDSGTIAKLEAVKPLLVSKKISI